MAVNLLRRRKTEETPAPEPQPQPRSHWPRIAWVRRSAEAEPKRRRRPPWRRRPYNPISVALWAASWAAVLILVLGMLLVSADANQANGFVHATMRTGEWLATPFRDVFHNATTHSSPDAATRDLHLVRVQLPYLLFVHGLDAFEQGDASSHSSLQIT